MRYVQDGDVVNKSAKMYRRGMRSRAQPDESTPICRCRVLYLGSAVPHLSKDGLQGIQEPLKELYPEEGAAGAKGIDSWLSVWSNGLLLENIDEHHKKISRFFPIDSLHYCAAVRHVVVPVSNGSEKSPRFLPLDSPFARNPSIAHPPLFACILRRTTGIKVLECHVFICKREVAANALVRCCFHAFADSTYAKQLENGAPAAPIYQNGGVRSNGSVNGDSVNGISKVEEWAVNGEITTTNILHQDAPNGMTNGHGAGPSSTPDIDQIDGISPDDISIYNGLEENHKVWTGNGHLQNGDAIYMEYGENGTLRSVRSNATATGRSNRPRQIMMPVAPPPPPPVLEDENDKTLKKMKKKEQKKISRKNSSAAQRDMYRHVNGSLMRPVSALDLRSTSAMAMHHPHPHPAMMKQNGTLIKTGNGYGPTLYAVPMRPMPSRQGYRSMKPPPPMGNVIVHQPPPPRPVMVPVPHWNPYKMEEPIYHPGTPMINHPGTPMINHPGTPMITPIPPTPIQMATTDRKTKKNKKSKELQQMHHNGDVSPFNTGMYPPPQHNGKASPKIVESSPYNTAGIYRPNKGQPKDGHTSPFNAEIYHHQKGSSPDEESSPFNTGIYRSKGHLNERAFSYSIRQEHRSRSYGSLANLKFCESPAPCADPWKEDVKKEREIIQMVKDLELSGDDIERSEVHPSVYESRMRRVSTSSSRR